MHLAKVAWLIALAFLLGYEAWAGIRYGVTWTLSYAVWDLCGRFIWFRPVSLFLITLLTSHFLFKRTLWPPFGKRKETL